ncbi:MAG: DUF3305 domain-containing protein [Hyphomicrobiaceae bacterium]
MSTIERTTSLTVGVVIAREPIDHPWQDFRWRPVELLIGHPKLAIGDTITETEQQTQFFGGSFTIELHRKETSGYLVNLENDPPVVYIVMREAEDDDPDDALPVIVEMVTVTPFEAQDFLDSGEDIVEPLTMPEPLVAWLQRFVATHHEEEVFIKRKRDKLDIRNEKFGQEPIDQIRRRQRRQ